MPPRKRLGQLLTELHVVDEHQLHSALGHQKQWGGKLGAILVQKGFCKEEQVVSALATHLGMPVVKLSTQKVDPRAVKLVTRPIAEKLHVFAYEVTGSGRGEVVTIAMSDPTDLSAVDQLAFHTGKRIKPMLCGDSEIVNAIVSNYGDGQPAPAPKPAAPAAAPPAAGTPSATLAFPRRIEPQQPAVAPAPAPYVPPPVPARPARPVAELEEIEPVDPDSFANLAPAQPAVRQEPLELSEADGAADGPMEGLEPLAAHVQAGGDEVAGQEEVAGDGTAADALEGLEAASEATRHEGADGASMEDVEGSDAQPPGSAWDAAPAGESSEWGATPEGGWDDAPPAEPELPAQEGESPAEGAWGEPEAAAQPEAAGEATEWGAAADAPDVAWGTAQSEWGAAGQPEAEAGAEREAEASEFHEPAADLEPAAEEQSEELPADAIIGTADALEGEPGPWGDAAPPDEPGDGEAAPAAEAPGEPDAALAGQEPVEGPAADPDAAEEEQGVAALDAPEASDLELHEAEAPDAWATSEDPLAAGQEPAQATAWAEAAPQAEQADPEQAWDGPADASAPPEPDAWGDAPAGGEPAAEAEQAAEEPAASAEPAGDVGWPQDAEGDQSSEGIADQPESTEPPFGEPGPGPEDQLPSDAQAAPFGEEASADDQGSAEDLKAEASGAGASEQDEQWAAAEALPTEPAVGETGDGVHGVDHEPLLESAPHEEELTAELDGGAPADAEPHAESAAGEPQTGLAADDAPAGAGEQEASVFDDGHAVPDASEDAGAETAGTSAQSFDSEGAPEESAADDGTAGLEDAPVAEPSTDEQGTAESELEGWVSPPPEPPAEGAGWLGEALAATIPLSAADLQTLSAVGVDPNDGVGALRLLAGLLRVLRGRGTIDFDELAGDLAQSREGSSGAASAAPEPEDAL